MNRFDIRYGLLLLLGIGQRYGYCFLVVNVSKYKSISLLSSIFIFQQDDKRSVSSKFKFLQFKTILPTQITHVS